MCGSQKNALTRLYWVFLSLPDRCVCEGGCAPSYCGGVGHRSRHRVLCANLSDLPDMACVLDVCWGCTSLSLALSAAASVTDMYLCAPTGMVRWLVLQGKDPLHWLSSQSQCAVYTKTTITTTSTIIITILLLL